MNKVINGILFTKLFVTYDDGISPETEAFTDCAIELETINAYYDVTGNGQKEILQNKVKLVTCSNIDYIIDMTFTEFKEIFIKFRTETDKDFMKNIFLKTRN